MIDGYQPVTVAGDKERHTKKRQITARIIHTRDECEVGDAPRKRHNKKKKLGENPLNCRRGRVISLSKKQTSMRQYLKS